MPCVAVLSPLIKVFEAYLGTPSTPVIGGQHVLNTDYFRRIEAMNFTLAHDDGQRTEDIDEADIVLIGASRTSKTPTSLYLANRGFKTANVSLVPDIPPPPSLEHGAQSGGRGARRQPAAPRRNPAAPAPRHERHARTRTIPTPK